jgi:hypothetical protein
MSVLFHVSDELHMNMRRPVPVLLFISQCSDTFTSFKLRAKNMKVKRGTAQVTIQAEKELIIQLMSQDDGGSVVR